MLILREMQKKTIEQIYQKKTQLEHILLRPDTYIGSVEHDTQQLWVYNGETQKFEYRAVKYVPGLYKIFGKWRPPKCSRVNGFVSR